VYDFLVAIIELFSLALTVARYKAKRAKTRCYQEGEVSSSQDFRGKGSSLGNILKVDTFSYLPVQTAPCCVQSF